MKDLIITMLTIMFMLCSAAWVVGSFIATIFILCELQTYWPHLLYIIPGTGLAVGYIYWTCEH